MTRSVLPIVTTLILPADALAAAFAQAETRGVRGGAIFDLLHLMAANHAGLKRIYTLDVRDFKALHRPGDAEILSP